ncbi:MAG: hypothetical protein JSS76_14100 [Bacteroidetes bacterium]|nr:hypothetical protein [Bacteroidota bacterium]
MRLQKEQAYHYLILCLCWYLAYSMADYGIAKITGGQFGIWDPSLLSKPLKDVDTFHLAWHLFGRSRIFNWIVGLAQIGGAILIVLPRTRLIGALVLLPVLVQIFLIDVCFTTGMFGMALPVRLAGMIICDLAILYYDKAVVVQAIKSLTSRVYGFRYHWGLYVLVPVIGFAMDFILAILMWPVKLLLTWLFIWHKC